MKEIIPIGVLIACIWLFYFGMFWIKKKDSHESFWKQFMINKFEYLKCFCFVGINSWFLYGIGSPKKYIMTYLLCFTMEVPIIFFTASKGKRKEHIVELVVSVIMICILFYRLKE